MSETSRRICMNIVWQINAFEHENTQQTNEKCGVAIYVLCKKAINISKKCIKRDLQAIHENANL